MRVICVKWGKKYDAKWVHRLKSMVSRHLPIKHDFVCMTDKPIDGVTCVPCAEGLPGWWSKVGLFEPGKFPGVNLYLDLDVVITDDISGIVDCLNPKKVMAPDDFSYSLVNPKQGMGSETRRLLGGDGTVNSSVMVWQDDTGRDVWDKFYPGVMDVLHGDQNWITQMLWPDKLGLLPKRLICSYKYHVQRGEAIAPVVVFHGDPKVTQLSRTDPLRLAWAS